MHIQKVMKPKDAIRIYSEKDIPDFLADTIRVDGEQIICLSAEGYSEAPLGSVIGFDRNAPTETGKGAWQLGEGSFIEQDGVIYPAPEIRTAVRIDAPFSLDTPWGIQELHEGEQGYLVTTPRGEQNILNLHTTSAADYMVCTEHGTNICPLPDFADRVPLEAIQQLFDTGDREQKTEIAGFVSEFLQETKDYIDRQMEKFLEEPDKTSEYYLGENPDGSFIIDEDLALSSIITNLPFSSIQDLDALQMMQTDMSHELDMEAVHDIQSRDEIGEERE